MSKNWTEESISTVASLYETHTYPEIAKILLKEFGLIKTPNAIRKAFKRFKDGTAIKQPKEQPKVFIYDIETAPIEAYVWGLWNNDVSLGQVMEDWFVMSWSGKWLGEDNVMYMDQRKCKNRSAMENDLNILQAIWYILDEADIVITQNGKKFDQKKLNARFIIHGFDPPSSYKHIDTLQIARKHFGFTSNKLAYMTDKLCTKYKKLDHGKFPGMKLWTECLKGNQEAWQEMEEYNRYDVLSLEELYTKLIPWDDSINFNLYHDSTENQCKCGSTKFKKKGYHYTGTGKFQKYKCVKCGSETRDRINLFSKEKRASLRMRT